MSKIDDLIKELCPDGVRFVCLDEVANLRRGSAITKKNIIPGDVPVIAGGQKPAYFHSESNRCADTVVVAGSGLMRVLLVFGLCQFLFLMHLVLSPLTVK